MPVKPTSQWCRDPDVWDERRQLREAINHELMAVLQFSSIPDRAFFIRVLVRVLMTTIDAYCFYLKSWILGGLDTDGLSVDDLRILREATERKRNDGSVYLKPYHVPIRDSVVVSLDCLGRAFSTGVPVLDSGDLPSAVVTAIDLRHRLTHPKSATDFEVSEADQHAVEEAVEWYMEVVRWVMHLEEEYFEACRQRRGQRP